MLQNSHNIKNTLSALFSSILKYCVLGRFFILFFMSMGMWSAAQAQNVSFDAVYARATAGDAQAQYLLGLWYKDGVGVKEDSKAAAAYLMQAANAQYIPAFAPLAEMYMTGKGVSKSYAQSVLYAEKSAAANDPWGLYLYGKAYEKGIVDIPKDEQLNDYQLALYWYYRAARKGNTEAMVRLGDFYDTGKGAEKNIYEAFKWYYRAAEKRNIDGLIQAGLRLFEGKGCQKNISLAQRLLFLVPDEDMPAIGIVRVGFFYYKGINVAPNYILAQKRFEYGVKKGVPEAYGYLAEMYYNGGYLEKDYTKARDLYLEASRRGYDGAYEKLGMLYYNGLGGDKDTAKAFAAYVKAAKRGSSFAMEQLAFMAYRGYGVRPNVQDAYFWLYLYHMTTGRPSRYHTIGQQVDSGERSKIEAKAVKWAKKYFAR